MHLRPIVSVVTTVSTAATLWAGEPIAHLRDEDGAVVEVAQQSPFVPGRELGRQRHRRAHGTDEQTTEMWFSCQYELPQLDPGGQPCRSTHALRTPITL